MKRLIENTVLVGLVMACRLATWPTSRSPPLVNATTDGMVRPPSALGMTVGSPPSITATTEFVVPRSMPMILPMSPVSPWKVRGWVVWEVSVDGAGGVRLGRRRDGDQRGPDDRVAEPVPSPDLVDDLALLAAGPRDADDGFVLTRVECGAGCGIERRDALALEQQPQLAIDRRDALEPGVSLQAPGGVRDGAVEVVREVQDLADEVLPGEAGVALTLHRSAPSEVGELGAFTLERGQVFVGLGDGLVAGCRHLGKLGGQGCRGDIELLDALLGAGLAVHRSPGLSHASVTR